MVKSRLGAMYAVICGGPQKLEVLFVPHGQILEIQDLTCLISPGFIWLSFNSMIHNLEKFILGNMLLSDTT